MQKNNKKQVRRLVSLVFVNVVGSSKLALQDELEGITLWSRYLSLTKKIAKKHDGNIATNIGDSMLLSFSSAAAAVEFASNLLSELKNFNAMHRPKTPIRLKIGVTAGEVVAMNSDLLGTPVNLAMNLASLARANEILCNEAVWQLVADELPLKFQEKKQVVEGLGRVNLYSLSNQLRRKHAIA
jgi:class 3 adenylate cyclase